MIFEEQFPSLMRKFHTITEFIPGDIPEEEIFTKKGIEKIKLCPEPNKFEGRTINKIGDSGRVYNEEDIQKHCLDKQKVREAIISAFEKGSLISRAEIREILTKELGL